MNNSIVYTRLRELVYYKEGNLYWIKTNKQCGSIDNNGYKRVSLDRVRYKIHRVIWFYFNKEWPQGQIDHINGDKLDNRIENLRDVSQTINMYNKQKAHKNSKTNFLGVSNTSSGKYSARIRVNNILVHLGSYNTPQEAQQVYKEYKNRITLFKMD